MLTRRSFVRKVVALAVAGGAIGETSPVMSAMKRTVNPVSFIYRAVNGNPRENIEKAVDLAGGLGKIIGSDDMVLIKPNGQWWNQGAPNLAALERFVELVFGGTGGFRGEVVIAENCHRGPRPWQSIHSGWAPVYGRNADLPEAGNLNDLCALLKKRHGRRFAVVHWVDVAAGSKRVKGPAEGAGYVYCDGTAGVPLLECDNGVQGPARRTTIMTYPVFVTDAGTTVDFRNGVWEKGAYTGRPLKFVNFSALNHHSTYCGMTSAIKNYMGITDLSGGPDPAEGGVLTGSHYNFHSFPFDKWSPGPRPGMLGREIGAFMRTVRKADLNITTAEWVGLSSRTDGPVARTRAVLASTDPVALDYHGAKYILRPNSRIDLHDPDREGGPLRQYLGECATEGGGVLDEARVGVSSFDLASGRFQRDSELTLIGDRVWGTDPKAILKYLYLRMLG